MISLAVFLKRKSLYRKRNLILNCSKTCFRMLTFRKLRFLVYPGLNNNKTTSNSAGYILTIFVINLIKAWSNYTEIRRQPTMGFLQLSTTVINTCKRSYVTALHLEKFSLNFSSSSFAIRVNLLHPWPSLFPFGLFLFLWCFSSLSNYHLKVSFQLTMIQRPKKTTQNIAM